MRSRTLRQMAGPSTFVGTELDATRRPVAIDTLAVFADVMQSAQIAPLRTREPQVVPS